MKNYLLSTLLVAFTLQLFAQNSPPTVKRSPDNITYSDSFLTIPKRLGIPTASSDILDAIETPQNSAKLLYNTTLNKLRVYNPVSGLWRDAIEADLTNYYTKAEIDALFSAIPQPDLSPYIKGDDLNEKEFIVLNKNNADGRPLSYTAISPMGFNTLNARYNPDGTVIVFNQGGFEIAKDYDSDTNGKLSFTLSDQMSNEIGNTIATVTYLSNPDVKRLLTGGDLSGNTFAYSYTNTPITQTDNLNNGRDKVLALSVNNTFADSYGNITLPQPDLSSYLRIDNPNTGDELRFNKNVYEAIFRTSTNTRLGLASFKSNRDFWNEETSELIEAKSLNMTAGEIFPGYYELSRFEAVSQAEGKFASGSIILPSSGSMLYEPSQSNYSQLISNVKLPYTSANDLDGNTIKYTETPPFLALTVNNQYADEFGNISIPVVVLDEQNIGQSFSFSSGANNARLTSGGFSSQLDDTDFNMIRQMNFNSNQLNSATYSKTSSNQSNSTIKLLNIAEDLPSGETEVLSQIKVPITTQYSGSGGGSSTERVIPVSVNGNFADKFGNITIPSSAVGGNRLRGTNAGMYTSLNSESNPINLNLDNFDFFESSVGTSDANIYYNIQFTNSGVFDTRVFRLFIHNNVTDVNPVVIFQGKTNKWKNEVKNLPNGDTILEVTVYGSSVFIDSKSYVN